MSLKYKLLGDRSHFYVGDTGQTIELVECGKEGCPVELRTALAFAYATAYLGTDDNAGKLLIDVPDNLLNIPGLLTISVGCHDDEDTEYTGCEFTIRIVGNYVANPNSGTGGSGGSGDKNVQADWSQNDETADDYVKNRPGGYKIKDEINITWDGNTEGLTSVQVTDNMSIYKISDVIFTADEAIGMTVTFSDEKSFNITQNDLQVDNSNNDFFGIKESKGFIAYVILKDNLNVEGITFQEAGIYTMPALDDEGTYVQNIHKDKTYAKIPEDLLDLSELKSNVDTLQSSVKNAGCKVIRVTNMPSSWWPRNAYTSESAKISLFNSAENYFTVKNALYSSNFVIACNEIKYRPIYYSIVQNDIYITLMVSLMDGATPDVPGLLDLKMYQGSNVFEITNERPFNTYVKE